MRVKIICAGVFLIILSIGWSALAQEIVATPDPVGGPKIDAGTGVPGGANVAARSTNNDWRYRQFEGRWWYWTPQNRWLWYSDDGRWVPFDENQTQAAIVPNYNPPVYQSYYPGGYYYPGAGYYDSYPGYYYGRPGYWNGYYPGVAVGVGPYGNVNVGVGGRVGVDVWGPHGGVRVGGIRVGW
jgi:hypothetical protein